MRRACKAPPALIAEGYAKKHHRKSWKKYLDGALGECNEMIVHLSFCLDLGHPEEALCHELSDLYDKTGKQLYNLGKKWQSYDEKT